MSFFDKVTKAVGDVVDRGKAELDQFKRIQKINGEIAEMEKTIAECKSQIQTATQQAGEKAIVLVRAGTIASPDLQGFVDQITGFEKQIAEESAAVAGKKKEIEAIKAEDEAAEAKAAEAKAAEAKAAEAKAAEATAAAPAPVSAPAVPAAAAPAPAAPAARFCNACGASIAGTGAFCPQCGAKQG